MSRFEVLPTPFDGLYEVVRQPIRDDRGFLARLFCGDELGRIGFDRPVAQINHTLTRSCGSVRGMHFQHPPHAEDKLVSCIRGEVFDVAVDIRRGSSTFLEWHGAALSAENGRALLIPRGFAHGFQTLTEDCELLYLHSHPYAAGSEGGLNPADPKLAIAWPAPIASMSDRDRAHPFIDQSFAGVQS